MQAWVPGSDLGAAVMKSQESKLLPSLPVALAWLHGHFPHLTDVTLEALPRRHTSGAEVSRVIISGAGLPNQRRGRTCNILVGRSMPPLTIKTASWSFCYVPDPVLSFTGISSLAPANATGVEGGPGVPRRESHPGPAQSLGK